MYECPNCSSDLKFNIEFQQLTCGHCDSRFNVDEVDSWKGADEDSSFDVTMFTCSQCGGELYTTDNTIAGFCSFCGSSTILESRIEKELRPDYIIPFSKTKEDCKKEYIKKMRWAIFAPKQLKKEKYIESFRGIYMPYWLYEVKQNNVVTLQGSVSSKCDEYTITRFYDVKTQLNMQYSGIAYDGSSSFADNISEKIAPYKTDSMKEFSPAYLSGFYANTADVESSVYEKNAINTAGEKAENYIRNHQDFKQYQIVEEGDEFREKLGFTVDTVKRGMLPVWFLSYRNKDQIAYATVNGQTGKIVTDLPVDNKKYLFGTLILTIPLFLLINLMFSVQPQILLALATLLALIIARLHAMEIYEIVVREKHEDDIGALTAVQRIKHKRTKKPKKILTVKEFLKRLSIVPVIIVAIVQIGSVGGLLFLLQALVMILTQVPLGILIMPVVIVFAVMTIDAYKESYLLTKELEKKDKIPKAVFCVVAVGISVVFSLVVAIMGSGFDWLYYAGFLATIGPIFITLWDLIQKYNILATNKIPQFEYMGGDNRE